MVAGAEGHPFHADELVVPMAFLHLAQACAVCLSAAQFEEVVRRHIRPILPHEQLAAVLGSVHPERLEFGPLIGVDYPCPALTPLETKLGSHRRPLFLRWLARREPLVLDLIEDWAFASPRERNEFAKCNLGRVAIHGAVDISARTGSYFILAQVDRAMPRDRICGILALIAPHLHQVMISMKAEAAPGQGLPIDRLSRAERELLHWVAAGRTNREIAALRNRSAATIRNQLHSVYSKLGVSGRVAALNLLLPGRF